MKKKYFFLISLFFLNLAGQPNEEKKYFFSQSVSLFFSNWTGPLFFLTTFFLITDEEKVLFFTALGV